MQTLQLSIEIFKKIRKIICFIFSVILGSMDFNAICSDAIICKMSENSNKCLSFSAVWPMKSVDQLTINWKEE